MTGIDFDRFQLSKLPALLCFVAGVAPSCVRSYILHLILHVSYNIISRDLLLE